MKQIPIFSLFQLKAFLFIFSFNLSWLREIIKDFEDLIGDKAHQINSLPIKYGIEISKKIVQVILFGTLGILFGVSFTHWDNQPFFVVYLILGLGLSLLIFYKQLQLAKEIKDYKKLSILLKIIILIGFFSVFLIKF